MALFSRLRILIVSLFRNESFSWGDGGLVVCSQEKQVQADLGWVGSDGEELSKLFRRQGLDSIPSF
jgi:hypothetical protein